MSQRPKSQNLKSNLELRNDPIHTEKFHKIVNVMILIEVTFEFASRNSESASMLLFNRSEKGLLLVT